MDKESLNEITKAVDFTCELYNNPQEICLVNQVQWVPPDGTPKELIEFVNAALRTQASDDLYDPKEVIKNALKKAIVKLRIAEQTAAKELSMDGQNLNQGTAAPTATASGEGKPADEAKTTIVKKGLPPWAAVAIPAATFVVGAGLGFILHDPISGIAKKSGAGTASFGGFGSLAF